MLEIDLNLDENSDEPRIYVLELLSAKLKGRIRSKKSLILSRVNCTNFPAHKDQGITTVDLHHTVERGKHKAARI